MENKCAYSACSNKFPKTYVLIEFIYHTLSETINDP